MIACDRDPVERAREKPSGHFLKKQMRDSIKKIIVLHPASKQHQQDLKLCVLSVMKQHSWSHVISLYAAKAGDPYDRRHQCDPAAPAEADGPRASSLQCCVAQPSPASPHHPVQHRSTHNSHGPSNPAGPDRQHRLTPTGVVFSLQIYILHQFLDINGTNSRNVCQSLNRQEGE